MSDIMKTFILSVLIFLLISGCSTSTQPDDTEGRFVVDTQEVTFDKSWTDSTLYYNTNFTIVYHLENESGNLTEYMYTLQILPYGFAIGTGWDDRGSNPPRGRTRHFLEAGQKDTLQISLKIGTKDTSRIVGYKFYIQGYYYDEPKFLSELEDEKNLDAFFYFYEDTLD